MVPYDCDLGPLPVDTEVKEHIVIFELNTPVGILYMQSEPNSNWPTVLKDQVETAGP